MASGVYLEGNFAAAVGTNSYTLNIYGNHDILFCIKDGVINVRQ